MNWHTDEISINTRLDLTWMLQGSLIFIIRLLQHTPATAFAVFETKDVNYVKKDQTISILGLKMIFSTNIRFRKRKKYKLQRSLHFWLIGIELL